MNRFVRQCAALVGPAVAAVRHRRYDRLWLGPAAALFVAGLAVAVRTGPGSAFVARWGVTHPGDPLLATVWRLPLSMFAPAALLPFWFAVLQVLIVYSVTQAAVGAWRTIGVAFAGHALATLSARAWMLAGPPVGVGHALAHYADAGPSASVVALLAYLAVTRRIAWAVAALIAYHATEVALISGLPPREHLVGTLVGACAAVAAVPATAGAAARLREVTRRAGRRCRVVTRRGGARRPARGPRRPPARPRTR
ncbi:hypothetical protein [Dactylosporangium sp. NPDC048998]|uniref:hypothetical protein n=1 Tax=Dactylosporangium sp. NPDC048998 TaxID=3363976 RepID=UPI00371A21D8